MGSDTIQFCRHRKNIQNSTHTLTQTVPLCHLLSLKASPKSRYSLEDITSSDASFFVVVLFLTNKTISGVSGHHSNTIHRIQHSSTYTLVLGNITLYWYNWNELYKVTKMCSELHFKAQLSSNKTQSLFTNQRTLKHTRTTYLKSKINVTPLKSVT